jgi:hypothetical protein
VKYHDVVAKSGADIVLSNHTVVDGSRTKLPGMVRPARGAIRILK